MIVGKKEELSRSGKGRKSGFGLVEGSSARRVKKGRTVMEGHQRPPGTHRGGKVNKKKSRSTPGPG